jgi:hypothetical protein
MHSNEVNKTAKIAWQRIKQFINDFFHVGFDFCF